MKRAMWIIVAKFPSGQEMAFSVFEENGKKTFALVPIHSETKSVKSANAWRSREDAEAYLKSQLAAAPKLEKLGPFEIRPMMEADA